MSDQDSSSDESTGAITLLQRRVAALEQELEQTQRRERQLRQIIDLVPDFIYAADWEGHYLLANKALADLYGLRLEELVGKSKHAVGPDPEQADRLLEADRKVLRSGTPTFVPELEVIDTHGKRRVVQHRRIPYVEAETRKKAVLGVATDITKRKQAQEEAEAARANLQDAIESIGDGFLLFDNEERLVMKNTRMTELASHLEENFRIGDCLENIIHALVDRDAITSFAEVDIQDREALVEARLASHRKAPSTHEQQFSNGRWVLVTTRPTEDGGRVVAYTDITEQKEAERSLREKQRIERDLDIARSIQHDLLPTRTPDIPGFEIAGWNQPADRTGGDYFDWVTLPNGCIVISIADVTGHGIGPALIVSVCRAYFRASSMIEHSLQRIVARVNDLLAQDLTQGRFVTAAIGILDPAKHTVQLYTAGQAPIFFYTASTRQLSSWAADGVPLGILAGTAFEDPRALTFEPGDMLVITTDGFYEWANPSGEQFGTQRMGEAILRRSALTPDQLIASLYDEVRLFTEGAPQQDDLTAVVLKRV